MRAPGAARHDQLPQIEVKFSVSHLDGMQFVANETVRGEDSGDVVGYQPVAVHR